MRTANLLLGAFNVSLVVFFFTLTACVNWFGLVCGALSIAIYFWRTE